MLTHAYNKILPLRARTEVRNAWLRQRLDEVLPELMQRADIDLWIVAAREYNEDPVIMTLLPQPAMSARRRTILIFFRRPDGTVERLTVDRYGYGELYVAAWNPEEEEQFDCLARLVREREPATIGLDVSAGTNFADGLTHSEYEAIVAALGETYAPRVRSAEPLALGWLERRIDPELTVYRDIVDLGHALIAEALSKYTIQPGITTTTDLVWWFRQRISDLGLQAWFQPMVDLQARGLPFTPIGAKGEQERRQVIQPGDLLHCDVGFCYLGLATDQQQLAYVLRPGEDDAPSGLRAGLAAANRLQEIHLAAMRPGRTGNQVLQDALDTARGEGLTPMIYTHPLGYHGHAAGPTIGLWDHQEGVPGGGDYELHEDTCYAIELNVQAPVPEWDGQTTMFALEEDALLADGRMRWLAGRQTTLHLIGP
jgi:Xaa-Pro aminopeptidase